MKYVILQLVLWRDVRFISTVLSFGSINI